MGVKDGDCGPPPQALLSIMHCVNMTAQFALTVIHETLESLDSCQDDDCSRILLRMKYFLKSYFYKLWGIMTIMTLSWLVEDLP